LEFESDLNAILADVLAVDVVGQDQLCLNRERLRVLRHNQLNYIRWQRWIGRNLEVERSKFAQIRGCAIDCDGREGDLLRAFFFFV